MPQLAKGLDPLRFELRPHALGDWRLVFFHPDLQTRFQVALFISFLLHLLVVVGITIRAPERKPDKGIPQLDVVLVNSRSAQAPAKADALAQANLDGGGTVEAERRARSPLPITKRPSPEPELSAQARRVETREREVPPVMTQSRESAPAIAQPDPSNRAEPQAEAAPAPSAADIVSRSMEVARLQAQIAKDFDSYQKRPRRRFIGASTQEFRFARYVEDWRSKVERIGTLNYPQAARDQRIFGTLRLTVAIRADGSVENVEINRPSGHSILDDAAVRIVRLAAPFGAFPPDIAKDTDILSITRTWSFTRSDQFQAE
jgi:protein TonB